MVCTFKQHSALHDHVALRPIEPLKLHRGRVDNTRVEDAATKAVETRNQLMNEAPILGSCFLASYLELWRRALKPRSMPDIVASQPDAVNAGQCRLTVNS